MVSLVSVNLEGMTSQYSCPSQVSFLFVQAETT
jgi:hypothetical protein